MTRALRLAYDLAEIGCHLCFFAAIVCTYWTMNP